MSSSSKGLSSLKLLHTCLGLARSIPVRKYLVAPGVSLPLSIRRRFSAPTGEMATKLVLEKESHQYNWERAFEEIQSKERNSDRFTRLSATVAYNESNIELNRYHNVLAYDHSRALITHNKNEVYINANVVKCGGSGREYILTQGPLRGTVDDFWLMVLQYNSSVIVMLCSCVENNRGKSSQYWPVEVGDTMVLGDVREGLELEVTHTSLQDMGHYIIRNFVLTDLVTGVEREVKQFHYLDWPDFNVPQSPKLFLEFLRDFSESGAFLESTGPPIVHCSAGIGRSGTLILVDSILVMASLGTDVNMRKVMDTLLDMRTYRMGLIQTSEQLQFSVDAIVQGLKVLEVGNCADSQSPNQTYLNGKRLKENQTDEEEEDQSSPKAKKRKNSPSS